jgi:hypothetical protein
MNKKHGILLIICFFQSFFVQAQEGKDELKTLLRETKKMLGNYQQALNRLGSPNTDFVALSPLADSIAYHFFASTGSKVLNDLEPNAKDLLLAPIENYLGNMALSSRRGIVTSFQICNARISPLLKTSRDSTFQYFDIVIDRKIVGFNQDGKEINTSDKMSIFISFKTFMENKDGANQKVYKNFLIRKIELCPFDLSDYVGEPSEFTLQYAPSKVYLSSHPSITWKTPRSTGELNIELWEVGKSKPTTLVSNLPLKTQRYKWNVGNSLEVGKNYVLRVKNLSDPLCMGAETSPFTAKPKIKKGRWIAVGSAVLVGTLALIFKNKIFPPEEPLLPDVPRNNPK